MILTGPKKRCNMGVQAICVNGSEVLIGSGDGDLMILDKEDLSAKVRNRPASHAMRVTTAGAPARARRGLVAGAA